MEGAGLEKGWLGLGHEYLYKFGGYLHRLTPNFPPSPALPPQGVKGARGAATARVELGEFVVWRLLDGSRFRDSRTVALENLSSLHPLRGKGWGWGEVRSEAVNATSKLMLLQRQQHPIK
jgi:hypothetical protein